MTAAALDKQAAAPLWQTVLALAPIVTALFICSSRYADFHHAGFDIISGAVIGTVLGWASFRNYHLPIPRGYGLLAWGRRTRRHAFISAVGDIEPFDEECVVLNHELNTFRSAVPERVHTDRSGQSILSQHPNQASGRLTTQSHQISPI